MSRDWNSYFVGSLGSMSCHGTLYDEELPAASVVDTW